MSRSRFVTVATVLRCFRFLQVFGVTLQEARVVTLLVMKLLVTTTAIILLVLTMPTGVAHAAQRVVTASDPAEAPPVLSGAKQPDVTQVEATYDDAGSLTVAITFAESVPAALSSERLSFWTWIDVNERDRNGCGGYTGAAQVQSLATIPNSVGVQTTSTATISGFDGEAATTSTMSADGLLLTWRFDHPALAGRDFRCVTVRVYGFVRSYPSHPSSRYSTSCDCWTVSSDYDAVDPAFFTNPDGSTVADLAMTGAQAKGYLRTAITRELRRTPVGLVTACRPVLPIGMRSCTVRWRDARGTYAGTARVQLRELLAVRSWRYSLNVLMTKAGCRPIRSVTCRSRIVAPLRVGQTNLP